MNNRTGITQFELNGSARDVRLFATAANVRNETKAGGKNNTTILDTSQSYLF